MNRIRRRRVPSLLVMCALLAGGGSAVPVNGGVDPLASSGGNWTLRFSDDFDGTRLDPEKWASGYGWGPVAERRFGYCDPDHNQVAGGLLTQRIERRAQGGRPFSNGCANTKGRFAQLYGYWEARIRVAGCRGARSAFWAKPNNESWPPELDIIEVLGTRRREAQLTLHWRQGGRHRRSKGVVDGPEFYRDFHVFGAEWTPSGTTWFVDGFKFRHTRDGASYMNDGGPFYTMLEAHVLDPDSPCGRYPYFSAQQVDYVRIWSR